MQTLSVFLASHHHVLAYLAQAVRSGVWLVILIALFAPLEHFFSVRPAKLFQKGSLVNVGWYFINSLAPIFRVGEPGRPESDPGACACLIRWLDVELFRARESALAARPA